MFHTYNLHRHMQSYTFLSYHGSFQVIYISSCSYQHALVTIYISLHITNLYTYLYLYQTYTCSNLPQELQSLYLYRGAYTRTCTSIYLILVQISRRIYRAYTYTEDLIHVLALLSILYLFYGAYTCIYLILFMNNYDYHIYLLFLLIYGPNMSSNFIILCMDGFLTQWDFHRVQEHPKWSSDEEVMTFRSWMSHVVKPSRADLLWPS